MKNKDWGKIETIFHKAVSLDAGKRSEYLSRACAGNDWLRGEVESLITALDNEPKFMEEPAFNSGLKVIHRNSEASLTGQIIGVYRVKQKLGEGGMGAVYLAEDTRLQRPVALKFLSNALIGDNWAKRQLVKEAQAVAMLDHPNVCSVHGIAETNEHNFIVMQYVEGETLSRLIHNRLVKPEDILPMARQIVEGLAAAHEHGIIHRDIKPGNIIVTPTGQVKVLDFGLAKIIEQKNKSLHAENDISHAARKELILGTVAYMSPEQLRREKLDYRSDIFSLGVLLFELSTFQHPFACENEADTIAAVLSCEPAAAGDVNNSKQPSAFNGIIKKCLAKDKDRRYQSASEILVEFQILEQNIRPRINYLGFFSVFLISLLMLVVASGAFFYFRAAKVSSLAVLPFENKSSDARIDYLTDGLAESLINNLSNSANLRVKTFSIVSGYQGNDIDPLKAGRELDVDAVIVGTITRENNQFVLETKLIDTTDGSQLWGGENVFQGSEVLFQQKEISEKIISRFEPARKNNSEERQIRPNTQTVNPEAFRYYLIGRYYWKKRDRENILKAIDAFQQSINADPSYARAYAGLADSYVLLSLTAYGSTPTAEAMIKAKAAAKQALEIDEESCEAHTSLGIVLLKYDWNWTEAEREFSRALELNPEYAPAHYWYSSFLAITGRGEESISEAKKARELDPFSPLVDMNLARTYYYARRFDEALGILSTKSETGAVDTKTQYMIGLIYLQKGMHGEALEIFENIYASNKSFGSAALGYTYAKMGRRKEAVKIVAELDRASVENYIPPQEKAIIFIGLKENEKALQYLEEAFAEKHQSLISLNVEPLFDGLHAEKKYVELLKRMNLNF